MITEYWRCKLYWMPNANLHNAQGTPSQLQDANLYKHAAVPDIKNVCTAHNRASYVTCHASHILSNHVSPEVIHSYAQRTCCLWRIPTFHKFTININPDLENKLWTKAYRFKSRFSLIKRFYCKFLPAYLPYLAFVRNCKASFPGEIRTMIANTGLTALLYLISGKIPVRAEPPSLLSFIFSLTTYCDIAHWHSTYAYVATYLTRGPAQGLGSL